MILIIGDPIDYHIRVFEHSLRDRGAEVVRFDLAEVPQGARVSAEVADGTKAVISACRERGDFDLSSVKTVLFRRMYPVKPDERLPTKDSEFVKREATAFLMSLAQLLGDRFCVNPIAPYVTNERGNGKLSQLAVASSRGLLIPRTLATNDPERARDFLLSCNGGAIYKPFRPFFDTSKDGRARTQTIFTTKLDEKALEQIEGVRLAPSIFQELVPKKFEVRVTVIGNKVFATEIHSQVNERSSVDFRAHYDLGRTPYCVHELPAAMVEKLLLVHRDLGLIYGAYDLIVRPDGSYVFLEVNQQGQFLWLESQTGQPLLENFCQLLLQGRPDFKCDAGIHDPGIPPMPPLDPVTSRELVEEAGHVGHVGKSYWGGGIRGVP